MKVFIYSLQKGISQIISDHLSDKGHVCFVFESISDLSDSLRKLSVMADLLIMDYLAFNHDVFNIYAHFKRLNIKIPLIYYNDPCLLRSTRAKHWMSHIEITQTTADKYDFSEYEPLFNDLAELIESEEFKPYISLLQPPKELPEHLIKDKYTLQYLKENQDDCIFEFKKRNNLPANLFFLLTVLQKNRNIGLTYNDIVNIYQKEGRSITKESLKVLMSKLKAVIHADHNCNFLIQHEKDRYRFVRYKV